MRNISKILPFLILFFFSFPTLSLAGQFKVTRVVDGDTIVVNYQGNPEKVRLLCVNTPESVHPDVKQNVPMGKVASDYTKGRLQGKYVDLEFEGSLRGKYGRLLAYVIVDGKNFNLELVREGLSPYYTKYGRSQKYDRDFQIAERYARKQGLGIWGDKILTQKYLRLKSKWGQQATSEKQPSPNIKEIVYHGNIKSKKFHRPTCRYYDCKNCTAIFYSRDKAITAEYRPCKICKP